MLPWNDKVKLSKKLTVFGDSSLETGAWRGLLAEGMKLVTNLLRSHGIHCAFEAEATQEKANVEVELVAGAFTYKWKGKDVPESLNGTDLHGLTLGLVKHASRNPAEDRGDKALVFLPRTPMAANQPAKRNGLTWILCHELIHAIGLDDEEHSKGDADLFAERGVYSPSADQVAGTKGGKQVMMPPFFLSTETLRNLHKVW